MSQGSTQRAVTPVKLTVYTPLPELLTPPNVPVPPTALEVNTGALDIPLGFGLPYTSIAVNVTVKLDPDATEVAFPAKVT